MNRFGRPAESLGYFVPLAATAWLTYYLLPRPRLTPGLCPRCGYDRGSVLVCNLDVERQRALAA